MAVSTTSNDEITRRDKDLPNLRRRMETISDKIKSLMNQPTDEKTLKDIEDKYKKLLTSLNVYATKLKSEADSRELE